jgi:hypothetical protein
VELPPPLGVGVGPDEGIACDAAWPWTIATRSVRSVVSRTTIRLAVSLGGSHELPANGNVTCTVTLCVVSPMTAGFTEIDAFRTPARASKSFAWAIASFTLAPGTITCRAASYAALSAA